MAKYQCIQFGICPRADACEEIEIKPGETFECPRHDPKCREQLMEIRGGKFSPKLKMALIAVPIVLLLGFGAWAMLGSKKPASQASVEQMLTDFRTAHDLRSVSLRYFNAAGASRSGAIGERHEPETHLIPNVLRACRERRAVAVFGVDYPTPDGSCVRDYVHVSDLCRAHLAALEYLWNGGDNNAINLGSECGFSVLEVIRAAERICSQTIEHRIAPRRGGDAPVLVASSQRARTVLGWAPSESDLETIIGSAWRWENVRASHAV